MSDAVAAGEVEAPELRNGPSVGEAEPAIVEEIEVPPESSLSAIAQAGESPDPRDWDDRPLKPQELRRRMNLEPSKDGPVTDELFQKYHAAMSTLVVGDTNKRHRIQEYLFNAESSHDLQPWQLGRMYFWVGTRKEILQEANEEEGIKEISEWVPNPHAIAEADAIVREHQKETGQLRIFEEED